MKRFLYAFVFLFIAVIVTNAQVKRSVTPATFVDVYTNIAADGDTLLLDVGTYATTVAFPTGKSITLKANPAAATQPVLTFQLAEPIGANGSLTFDGLMISRSADYFFNSSAAQSMNRWKFVNCTIKNINKSLYNSTNKTGNITNFTFDKCLISACGTSGTSFLLVSQTVDSLNVTNSTVYNYIGGDFFHPNNGTTTKNISVSFINNTMYKCIWNNGYGWVSVGALYPAGNIYLFKNNIFDQGSNTDPVNNKPLLVYRGNGIANELNNIKINFQGNNSTTTNATNLTLGTAPFVGVTTIPYLDPAAGNFSLPSTSAFATAGVDGAPLGDPRWIKILSQPVTVTTDVSPAGAGTVLPAALTVNKGDTVAFSAKRNFGFKFKQWQDVMGNSVSKDSSFRMAITADTKLIAVYDTITTYSFDVIIKGSNWGQVQLNPASTNGRYEKGTEVALNVIPNFVTNFSFWEDNSTVTQRVVTVNENKSFTATFDEIPFIVGWDFKAQSPTSARPGDFYSETSNTGVINVLESVNGGAPSVVGWLPNTGFSPSYPNLRFWSAGAQFKTTRRHLKAQFATTNYKNIQVKSMISGNYQAYSILTMQYSLNDTTYKEFARVDLTKTFGNTWADLNALLPTEAENQPKVFVKWIADVTSPILNEGTDNDGTAITNVLVFADKNVPLDTTAPVFISAVPAAGSSTATVSGSIVITLSEKVKAATGNITLGSTILTGSYGSKTATFKYEKLSYDSVYTFTIPAGALTDLSGNVFAGITYKFRTAKRTEPAKKLFDAVVAQDGSGDYLTVIDAITAAPANRTIPWLIYIKNGKYVGHHDIPSNKPFIHLIGQQRDSVIITDKRLSGGDNAYSVNLGATMVVNSTDVYFEDLTLENSWGYENLAGPQALALYATTNHFTTNNVWLRSYQDTYLTAFSSNSDRQYLKNSKIEGAVDYIYGGGDIFFDRCTLTVNRPDGGFIVAPSHGIGTVWGYVFSNCTVDESPRITNGSNYFGRPWLNGPKTVFLNTTLKTGIKPAGWWYTFGTIPLIFADYNTMDKNGNPVDLSQRISYYEYNNTVGGVTTKVSGTAKNSLTDAEAATYTYENVTLRSGDSWDPRLMTEAPENPTNVRANAATITWNSSAYTRLYVIFRNNYVVGFTTSTTFTDTSAVKGSTYTYAVQAVGEFGALSGATNAINKILPIAFSGCPNVNLLIARAGYNSYNNEPLYMYNLDTATGKATVIAGGPLMDQTLNKNIELNGVGLNGQDGFVYGIRDTINAAGTARAALLYRVGNNYGNDLLGTLPAPVLSSGENLSVINPSAGGFDDQGNYYYIGIAGAYSFTNKSFAPSNYYIGKLANVSALAAGTGTLTATWTKIDFSNAPAAYKSSVYGTITSASGTGAGASFQDLTFSNLYKSIYVYAAYNTGQAYSGQLIAINPTTGLATFYINPATFGASNNEVAGISTTTSGNLRIFTTSGDIYKPVMANNGDFTSTLVKVGATSAPQLGVTGSIRGDLASCGVGASTLPTARPSSIITIGLPNQITAAPNPAQGVTTITVGQPLTNATVRLLGTAGNIIAEKNGVSGFSFQMDMTGKSVGIYTIEVIQGGNTQILKIMKP